MGKCLSCNIGEQDMFGEPTYIEEGYCVECRKMIKYETIRSSS